MKPDPTSFSSASALLFSAASLLPLAALAGQGPPGASAAHAPPRMGPQEAAHVQLPLDAPGLPPPVATASGRALDEVLTDDVGDGLVWAVGNTYKASFGRGAFTYVPFFGSQAPQNFPVAFELRAVRVGGKNLPLADGIPVRKDQVVHIDRGSVREQYDLALAHVGQTIVLDGAPPGDVELVLAVTSELVEDAALPGIQFGNELGRVDYGQAHVVNGGELVPVPTTFADGAITIAVPAGVRTPGRLVIDPIVASVAFASSAFVANSLETDIAYDTTLDRYMLVWEYEFSAADHDVYSLFASGSTGALVPGSIVGIDVTTASHQVPRVANLNASDRFLVVTQRYVIATATASTHGRIRPANAIPEVPFDISINAAGQATEPDVGGDPSLAGSDYWLVVYTRLLGPAAWIEARRVRFDGTVLPLFSLTPGSLIYGRASVANSNFTGTTPPRWLVAYQGQSTPGNWDIYGCVVAQDGTITQPNTAIDTSGVSDERPTVASPNTTFASGDPLWLVTYERQSPFEARGRLLDGQLLDQIPPVNLSLSGVGGSWVRTDGDGVRFAVVGSLVSPTTSIGVCTFAYDGASLVRHDGPHSLAPGVMAYPRLCSKRSAGGATAEYGIACIDGNVLPFAPRLSLYQGISPGSAQVTRRVMGCGGLQIDGTGIPALGGTLSFLLTNTGGDIPGYVFGTPIVANTAFCGACPLGVAPAGAILVLGPSLIVNVPATASLVGFAAGVQGFALGSGPCLLQLRFSDTLDFVVL